LTGDSKQSAAAGEAGVMQPAKTVDGGHTVLKSDARVGLSNFTFVKVLGKGSFGKVGVTPLEYSSLN